ncbi:hypothetical protein [Primorskyibacter marinus]|uniref:hypothetical protein n=1 Tax=Primorskyibacter marinus TaxID=1977320 RepID=UPI000E302960|nr:hypothetical protein [Primorskyibacter marinus]
MSLQTIYFVYTERKIHVGSTFMRCVQMNEILNATFGDRINARLVVMPERKSEGFAAQERWALSMPRDAVYFFAKTSVRSLTTVAARILGMRSRGILFDHVDEEPQKLRLELADRHICCSYAQLQRFRTIGPEVASKARLVLHAADIRLHNLPQAQQERFAPLYLGDPLNTQIPETLRPQIEVLNARDQNEFRAVLRHLPEYNLHFAARLFQSGLEQTAKPFLKGFTAAHIGANILLPRNVEDAEYFLGADYPYFYDESEGVEAAFERAYDDFGGHNWRKARERMIAMSNAVNPQMIARQLLDVVDEFY